jgi:hypothetical protein
MKRFFAFITVEHLHTVLMFLSDHMVILRRLDKHIRVESFYMHMCLDDSHDVSYDRSLTLLSAIHWLQYLQKNFAVDTQYSVIFCSDINSNEIFNSMRLSGHVAHKRCQQAV